MDSNVANCNKYLCLVTGIYGSFWVECNFKSKWRLLFTWIKLRLYSRTEILSLLLPCNPFSESLCLQMSFKHSMYMYISYHTSWHVHFKALCQKVAPIWGGSLPFKGYIGEKNTNLILSDIYRTDSLKKFDSKIFSCS